MNKSVMNVIPLAVILLTAGCMGGGSSTQTDLEADSNDLISELDSLDPEFAELDSLLEELDDSEVDALFSDEEVFSELI